MSRGSSLLTSFISGTSLIVKGEPKTTDYQSQKEPSNTTNAKPNSERLLFDEKHLLQFKSPAFSDVNRRFFLAWVLKASEGWWKGDKTLEWILINYNLGHLIIYKLNFIIVKMSIIVHALHFIPGGLVRRIM